MWRLTSGLHQRRNGCQHEQEDEKALQAPVEPKDAVHSENRCQQQGHSSPESQEDSSNSSNQSCSARPHRLKVDLTHIQEEQDDSDHAGHEE